MTFMYILIV